MRLIILTFAILGFFNLNAIKASSNLERPLSTILSHPQSAALIQRVERQGPVKVSYVSFGEEKVHALWEADTRTIFINKAINPSNNQILNSIIFELHNAASTRELEFLFDQAEKGVLSKDAFVEAIERMEHRNALAAQQLIENGIALGKFPENCRLHYYYDFDDYYVVQQLFGHSQWIAAKYDEFSPYRNTPYIGTISSLPLKSRKEKDLLLDYISYKNDPEFTNPKYRTAWIKDKYSKANSNEIALLNFVFYKELSRDPLQFSSAWAI